MKFEVNVVTRTGNPTRTLLVENEKEALDLSLKFAEMKVWSVNFVAATADPRTAKPCWVVRNGTRITV